MNGLDWLILLILSLSVLLAAAQGFFFETISLAGTIFGYLLAAWGYGKIAPWFLPYVKAQPFADLAGRFFLQSFCWREPSPGSCDGRFMKQDFVGWTVLWVERLVSFEAQ